MNFIIMKTYLKNENWSTNDKLVGNTPSGQGII